MSALPQRTTVIVGLLLVVVLAGTFMLSCTLYGTPVFRMAGDEKTANLPFWQAADDDYWYGFGIIDEGAHYDEVMRLVRGLPHTPHQALIPGYHVVLGTICRLTGTWQLPWVRYWHFLLSLGVLCLWGWMIRREDGTIPLPMLLQFVFMPLFILYYFVVYTDVAALGMLLLAYALCHRRRYVSSGIAGIAAVLVRQNCLPWVAFVAVLALVREDRWRPTLANLRWALRHCWTYLVCGVGFVAFALVNGSMTMNHIAGQAATGPHLGNLWFFMAVHVIVFLPLYVQHLPAVRRRFFRDWRRGLVTLLPAAVLFWPYILFFKWTHGYNRGLGFVHNEIVRWREFSILNMSIVFVVVYVGILALGTMRLREKRHYLLWLFTFLALVPIYPIEQRYYIPAVGFFLLLRKPCSGRVEWVLTAWIAVLGMLTLFGLVSQHYFL